MFGQPINDGSGMERGHTHPIGQREAMYLDPPPRQDLALAI